jgi:hypothetical protein
MTKARAALVAPNHERLWIELDDEEQVVIGCSSDTSATTPERPDYDLARILSPGGADGVALRHAILTCRNGDFLLKMVDGHKVWIGQYVLQPGRFFRVVDGDLLGFGAARFSFSTQ